MKGTKSVQFEGILTRIGQCIGPKRPASARQRREAQELVYDSWEASDTDTALELALRAFERDPRNIDAWLILLDLYGIDDAIAIQLLGPLVALAAKQLGPRLFKESEGCFWGMLETRPYMRARACLAERLMQLGRFDEAIIESEAMLKLNPRDNQGVRYGLMSCYLADSRILDARALFRTHNERTRTAAFAWAYVLERYLSNNLSDAKAALKKACQLNPHAADYFTRKRRLPRELPDSYEIGSNDEAVVAYDILRHAWNEHPAAFVWLRKQCPRPDKPRMAKAEIRIIEEGA